MDFSKPGKLYATANHHQYFSVMPPKKKLLRMATKVNPLQISASAQVILDWLKLIYWLWSWLELLNWFTELVYLIVCLTAPCQIPPFWWVCATNSLGNVWGMRGLQILVSDNVQITLLLIWLKLLIWYNWFEIIDLISCITKPRPIPLVGMCPSMCICMHTWRTTTLWERYKCP